MTGSAKHGKTRQMKKEPGINTSQGRFSSLHQKGEYQSAEGKEENLPLFRL